MIVISVTVMVFALKIRRWSMPHCGPWNASIIAGGVFVAIIAAVQIGLPTINEVPVTFPATLLWQFRLSAIGMQVILWTTIGLLFGGLIERTLQSGPVSKH